MRVCQKAKLFPLSMGLCFSDTSFILKHIKKYYESIDSNRKTFCRYSSRRN